MQETTGMQRVKVYRLNPEGMWDDKGTGSVSVEYMEQSDSVGLVVISEEDTRTLLIHRISRDDIYQRQGEDTIITWTDTELGTDIALSFQEAAGCNYVWEQILDVQTRSDMRRPSPDSSLGRRPAVDEFDQLGTSLEGDFPEAGSAGPVDLPAPEMGNLQDISNALREVSPFQRDRVAEQLLRSGYLRRLLDLFGDLEDLEDEAGLAALHTAVRGAIMLNDTGLLEALLAEENVMDVVGALEYDPEIPVRQRHREFLRDQVVFREVVPIVDPVVRSKIHQTYRMGYLKDVILPRVLDDATFATLSSLMLFNNVEVLTALSKDPRFFPDLFQRLGRGPGPRAAGNSAKAAPDESWVDLVAFLQELCGLAKHLQAGARSSLLTKLADLGLFQVMTSAMERGDDALRLRASDVLLAAGQHDPGPLRHFIESGPQQQRLLGLLITTLGQQNDGGLQEQALELLRLLLDPDSMDGPVEKNSFLELFYDQYMGKVLDLLTAGGDLNEEDGGAPAGSLTLVLELLCFCVGRHAYRIKYYILRNTCLEAALKLLKRREVWLGVAAIRFLRTCIGLKDEFYNRYVVRNNLFEPVITAFLENGSRYNLLNSVVLELVEFIRAENIKSLVTHLVEKFWPQLSDVDYVDTFRALKLKYDQAQERGGSGLGLGVTAAARDALAAERRRPDVRAPSRDEEDYFAEDDDEEEGPPGPAPSPADSGSGPMIGPRSPPSGRLPGANPFGLVDYEDDEESPESPSHPSAASDTDSISSSGSKRRILPLEAAEGLPDSPRGGKRPRSSGDGFPATNGDLPGGRSSPRGDGFSPRGGYSPRASASAGDHGRRQSPANGAASGSGGIDSSEEGQWQHGEQHDSNGSKNGGGSQTGPRRQSPLPMKFVIPQG